MQGHSAARIASLVVSFLLLITPTAAFAALSCSITFDKNPITQGESTQFHWSSTGADAFYVKSIGYVGSTGAATVAPMQTTDYSGTVYSCPEDYTLSDDLAQCSKTTASVTTTGTGGSQLFPGTPWGSGASTFTVPPYGSLTVEVWGGGGMSSAYLFDPNGTYCVEFQEPVQPGACDIAHSNGGQSSWNNEVFANGGQHAPTIAASQFSFADFTNAMGGAGGTASGGDVNTTGESGHQAPPGGDGLGGKTAGNPPSYTGLYRYGDGGGNDYLDTGMHNSGAGGGAGGYSKKTYAPGELTVGSMIPVVAGHDGIMAVSHLANHYGKPGLVRVTWTAPPSTTSVGGTDVVAPTTAACPAILTVNCAPGSHWDPMINQCVADAQQCLPGQHWDAAHNMCVDDSQCPVGQHWNGTECVAVNCPAGEHWDVAAGACVPNNCPAGEHWDATAGACVPNTSCPSGQHWSGTACVADNCPAGQVWNGTTCACPAGTVWYQNQCQIGLCVPGFECGQDGNVYRKDLQCNLSLYEECEWGCTNAVCNPPPQPRIITWKVSPTLVRKNATTGVFWNVINVLGCTVSGTNGDRWSLIKGSEVSSPLIARTTYTLHCTPYKGASWVDQTTVVNIVPVFQEK